jgi:hypothetical protein
MRQLFLAFVLLLNLSPNALAIDYDQSFWKTWSDGHAEIAAYSLKVPRYGEERSGLAVSIFVKEDFSESLKVKADQGKHPASDVFPVMKLNLIEDFQTGLYDYNLMTSSFVSLADVGEGVRKKGYPVKVSFSSQEWCGHVYHQLLFNKDHVQSTSHSYFDGEADKDEKLTSNAQGVSEDALLIWARGMAEPLLKPGESQEVQLLGSLTSSRLNHHPVRWSKARLSRSSKSSSLKTKAGTFKVDTLKAEIEGGTSWTYYVETTSPHRLIKWEDSSGKSAELLGEKRLRYWQMTKEGYEKALKDLGISARGENQT